MKTHFFFFVVLLAVMVSMMAVGQNAGVTLYVAAKTLEVKDSSGFFAKVIGTLAMGEAVTVQQNQGKWLVVRNGSGLQGWASADGFSSRRTSTGSSVSASEFALAGKGFTDDLEKVLRSSGGVDYSGVDAMEKLTIPLDELRTFLKEGRLAEGK